MRRGRWTGAEQGSQCHTGGRRRQRVEGSGELWWKAGSVRVWGQWQGLPAESGAGAASWRPCSPYPEGTGAVWSAVWSVVCFRQSLQCDQQCDQQWSAVWSDLCFRQSLQWTTIPFPLSSLTRPSAGHNICFAWRKHLSPLPVHMVPSGSRVDLWFKPGR